MAAAAIAGLSVGVVVLGRISVSYPVAGSLGDRRVRCAGAGADRLPADQSAGSGEVDREIGAWLGLIAAAGITLGGYLGMQELRPLRTPSAA